MRHIFALACAIFLLTFSPSLLANQVMDSGCHSADTKLIGPALKDTTTKH
jgi:cytochrome c551/c552